MKSLFTMYMKTGHPCQLFTVYPSLQGCTYYHKEVYLKLNYLFTNFNNKSYFFSKMEFAMNFLISIMDMATINMTTMWFVVALAFLLLELGNPGLFFFLSFFVGGMSACGATFFTEIIVWHIVLFFATTVGALVVFHYYVIPLLRKNRPHERTNVYALQGMQGFVIKTIHAQEAGLVKVNSELWAARSINGEVVEAGLLVEVVDVRGAHIIVKKL